MTIEKLLKKIPTTLQKSYSEKICECGKTRGEYVKYNLVIEGSYSAPFDMNRPDIEGNRYRVYYKPDFLGFYSKRPQEINDGMGAYRTLGEALENFYLYILENKII